MYVKVIKTSDLKRPKTHTFWDTLDINFAPVQYCNNNKQLLRFYRYIVHKSYKALLWHFYMYSRAREWYLIYQSIENLTFYWKGFWQFVHYLPNFLKTKIPFLSPEVLEKISFIKYYCFRRNVSLNSVFYDNGISFPFGMLQGLWFLQWNIEIRKRFMAYRPPPSPLCQEKLLPVYVFTYFAQYMKVACWHKGGGG